MKTLPIVLLCLFLGVVTRAEAAAALPRLVDLGAKKCIPCKQMILVLESLTTEYAGRLEVVFIDVWENRAAGKAYGIRIIPTQIFYDAAGKELFRHEGYWSKEAIVAKFKELGADLDSASSPTGATPPT
jgi:thioredoxin 1